MKLSLLVEGEKEDFMRVLRIVIVIIFLLSCAVGGVTLYDVYTRDTVCPVISDSVGELHLKVSENKELLFEGLTASDDVDGDLTDKIMLERVSRFSEPGVCNVSYVVFDKSNNIGKYERTVVYDGYESPRFTLKAPLLYGAGESIMLLDRFGLYDCLDGDISHKIKIESSNVTDSTAGIYEIELRASNNYGDEVYIKVPLNIIEYSADVPQIILKEYLAYTEVGKAVDPLEYVDEVLASDGTPLSVTQIKTVSQVDVSKIGGGQIKLEVTDSKGKTGFTYLTVIVEDK